MKGPADTVEVMRAIKKADEKAQVLRKFVEAQAVIGTMMAIIVAHHRAWVMLLALVFAFSLQWVQLYFMSRPCRVSQIRQWVSGMVAAIAIKYFAFALGLITIFSLNIDLLPQLGMAQERAIFFAVLMGVYCLPFWYSGLRLAQFRGSVEPVSIG